MRWKRPLAGPLEAADGEWAGGGSTRASRALKIRVPQLKSPPKTTFKGAKTKLSYGSGSSELGRIPSSTLKDWGSPFISSMLIVFKCI